MTIKQLQETFIVLQTELSFISHPTQNGSFRRRSSKPTSWPSTEKLKQTQQSKHASVTKYTTT